MSERVQIMGRVSEELTLMLHGSATARDMTMSNLVESGVESVLSMDAEELDRVRRVAEPFTGRSQLIARVDPELKKDAKHWAIDQEVTLNDVIRFGSVLEVGKSATAVGVLVDKLRVDFPEMFDGEGSVA